MKNLLILLVLLFSSPAMAGGAHAYIAGVGYDSDVESATSRNAAMIGIDASLYKDLYIDGFFMDENLGFGVKLNHAFGNFSVGAGVAYYSFSLDRAVDVQGVSVIGNGSDELLIPYVEASYRRFFVRYTQFEPDVDVRAHRVINPKTGEMAYSSQQFKSTERWLMVGFRF